ncbi:MAG: hypothetical protein ACK5QC_06530 [Bacteroidota bacterium]|nr:hypothetical protein [Bacteroidota bacterium]MCA6442089.1 hypothetical protein [Bacteroidota bacterium]
MNKYNLKLIIIIKNKKTISIYKASIFGLIYGTLLVAILIFLYYLVYGFESTELLKQFFKFKIFVPSIVFGIIVHEFIYGLTWSIGDLIILWITRKIPNNKNVKDHPTEGGVTIDS